MIGTVHNRAGNWYYLPELTCDLLIGVAIPNDTYILQDGYKVLNPDGFKFKENQIVNAEVLINYDNKECTIFKIL